MNKKSKSANRESRAILYKYIPAKDRKQKGRDNLKISE